MCRLNTDTGNTQYQLLLDYVLEVINLSEDTNNHARRRFSTLGIESEGGLIYALVQNSIEKLIQKAETLTNEKNIPDYKVPSRAWLIF